MKLRLLMITHGALECDFGLDFSINQKLMLKWKEQILLKTALEE